MTLEKLGKRECFSEHTEVLIPFPRLTLVTLKWIKFSGLMVFFFSCNSMPASVCVINE